MCPLNSEAYKESLALASVTIITSILAGGEAHVSPQL
jgi:hypothetical protein